MFGPSERLARPIRFLFALPGFHQEDRGAEVALLAVAEELARTGDLVHVIGSGPPRRGTSYDYRQVKAVNRRKFELLPKFPPFRSETAWEDATFALNLLRLYPKQNFDITITCNFPFTHWALRRCESGRSLSLFVTQNGDWPAVSNEREYRFFSCDGLICTNPDYQNRNRDRWRTELIPNGIDPVRFVNVAPNRPMFGLPQDRKVVLMVSALIESKRVMEGMRAVAALSDAHLIVAGDGPMRKQIDELARELLPGRFTRLVVPAENMPALYFSADAFLHMSAEESFGNVYVEAMAAGLPIVGQDSPRLRWIVGERDTLCDVESEGEVVRALTRALETGLGKPDERVANFAWSTIAQRYHDFAHALLLERGHREA